MKSVQNLYHLADKENIVVDRFALFSREALSIMDEDGSCFVAIDPAIFGDAQAIKEHLSAYLQTLRDAPKAEGQTRIYTHGEKEVEAERQLMANGIPVNDNTMCEVYEMCQYLDMDFSKYFGDYIPEKSEGFKSPETFK